MDVTQAEQAVGWGAQHWSALGAVASAAFALATAGIAYFALDYAKAQVHDARTRQKHVLLRQFLDRWSSERMAGCRATVNMAANGRPVNATNNRNEIEEAAEGSKRESPESLKAAFEQGYYGDTEAFYRMAAVGNFFEDLSIAVLNKEVERDEAVRLIGDSVGHYLMLFEPLVQKEKEGGLFYEWHRAFSPLMHLAKKNKERQDRLASEALNSTGDPEESPDVVEELPLGLPLSSAEPDTTS